MELENYLCACLLKYQTLKTYWRADIYSCPFILGPGHWREMTGHLHVLAPPDPMDSRVCGPRIAIWMPQGRQNFYNIKMLYITIITVIKGHYKDCDNSLLYVSHSTNIME
jgi:hypothetical protein